jgi:hypothetical protein
MLGLAVCVALPAAAGVPGQINFQGLLLDDQGAPVTGNVAMTFTLFDADTAGSSLWTESHPSVGVLDGVYEVALGSVSPLSASLLAGGSVYLEFVVDGETLTPRQRLLAVPYALRANEAESLGGLSSEIFTQIYDHVALDGGLPPNDDPLEGLQDTDGDGAANFVDSDNDNDGLSDSVEVAQGSHVNLVTPVLSGYAPPTADGWTTTSVQVSGDNFEPGIVVGFGSESPTPYAITANSFNVDVGPQTAGTVAVDVTLPNGETGSSSFDFFYFDPAISSIFPTRADEGATTPVTITGQNFITGLVAQVGTQTPTPTNVTPTSFDLLVGPQPPGIVDVTVTLPNGRSVTFVGAYEISVGSPRVMFASSETYDGNLGGVAGADAKCNQLALAAGHEGTFLAWIADSSVSPDTRDSKAGAPYVLTSGTVIANDWTDLTDGFINVAINRDEANALTGSPIFVWTNVTGQGVAEGADHCLDWTSSSSSDAGARGQTLTTNWTNSVSSLCSTPHRLYCIEQ